MDPVAPEDPRERRDVTARSVDEHADLRTVGGDCGDRLDVDEVADQ